VEIDETEWVKNKKNVVAFVIFTQMVGENGKSTHLQNIFNHLRQKWNKFTHIFLASTNSPTTHPVFTHSHGVSLMCSCSFSPVSSRIMTSYILIFVNRDSGQKTFAQKQKTMLRVRTQGEEEK